MKGTLVDLEYIKFDSVKKCDIYIKDILNKIGINITFKNYDKNNNTNYYDIFIKLFERHPEKEKKLNNIQDIKLIYNKLQKKDKENKSFECRIIYKNGTDDSISLKTCIEGKSKTDKQLLVDALRYSIDEQITEFKNKNINRIKICELCRKNILNNLHIDHVILFKNIISNFNEINKNIIPPVSFEKINDGTNRIKFKECDKEYENLFKKYHMENAILRPLCQKCNLTRSKNS
jgi:hypothetical protein